MRDFKRKNNITGWIVFVISLTVYLITLEPTASFWDCGEFIAASYKLEVGHPPGAPFFLLIGRLFSMLALDNPARVALMINAMSALTSAFTILFLFWTITHLARKIIPLEASPGLARQIAILGCGIVGALAYTFTDSFWFSAVEGEVYATSSLFTAVVFWAILKWEDEASDPQANRWLILIAYLMGLSIGVHLLNLLAIPAIVMVYYFKKFNPTPKGVAVAVGLSFLILAVVMYGIIQGILKIAGVFELFFVNTLGMGYNSGLLFYLLILTVLIIAALVYTQRTGKVILNTGLLMFAFIMIGYSSYTLVVIRSMADPPMDQNNPENLFNLLAYLNREQYGDRPLIWGQYYNAPAVEQQEGKPVYSYIDGRYKITMRKPVYSYDKRFETLFPRMYSASPDHIREYKRWGKITGRKVRINDGSEEVRTEIVPTFGENLRFFFRYQLGFMYFRYFMWNFSGRQNDIQGHGNVLNGNWLSGIPVIDNKRLGPQENLPDELKNNPGRNRYYFLPLLLGLAGAVYHYRKTKRDFFVVALLFFMTGIAIVIYLNQTPLQPRERDYAYVGSFYAFAIWIGLGVLCLFDLLQRKLSPLASGLIVTLFTLLLVPGILAAENWDDHNRAHRFTARDFAYNYLQSCEPNGIIFTNGDNDTFPLWYVQEVEGIRTDLRVVNLSYIGADWYIDQLKRKAYQSDPLPVSFNRKQYVQGQRDVIYLIDRGLSEPVEIRQALNFIASDDPKTKYHTGEGAIDYLPAKKFRMIIDTAKVLRNGTVPRKRATDVVPVMVWQIDRNYLIKNDLMVLDLLATNNWDRPIYFAITVSSDNYLDLDKYFHMHGLAYRVIPVYASGDMIDIGGMDTDVMYDCLMHRFRWGGINDPRVYLNEDNRRMLSNYRSNFARLATELIKENKYDSALKALDKCMELIPDSRIPYNYFNLSIADAYFQLNRREKGEEILNTLALQVQKNLDFYIALREKADELDYEKKLNLHILQEIIKRGNELKIDALNEKLHERFNYYLTVLSPTLKG